MPTAYENALRNRIQPPVHNMEINPGICLLNGDTRLVLEMPASLAAQQDEAAGLCRQYWNIDVNPEWKQSETALPPEGYRMQVIPGCITITCGDRAGLLNAFKSLRMLGESQRGVLTSSLWQLPCVTVEDAPRFSFRGLHLCLFPENELWEIEKYIRLAAALKFNYLVLESWGMIRYASHPEFCYGEYAVEPADIRALTALGKELGLTLIPQLNIFGHATQSRCSCAKHVLLNRHPEYAPLFEPDGWSWCLSNPATRKYLEELTLELCDIFDNPPFFHIGCDEAYNPGSCSLCQEDFPAKLLDHILHFYGLLKQRGIRTAMWHDMLIDGEDPEFQGFVAYGNPDTCRMLASLPRDILICDWEYDGAPRKTEPAWPTINFFKQAGFQSVICPWMNCTYTRQLANAAHEYDTAGILGTTWHYFRGLDFCNIAGETARAAWNPTYQRAPHITPREYINTALRKIDGDMKLTEYEKYGNCRHQLSLSPRQ